MENPCLGLATCTLHRAPVGQGLRPALQACHFLLLLFWYWRAFATGTAWAAGLCLIHHHHEEYKICCDPRPASHPPSSRGMAAVVYTTTRPQFRQTCGSRQLALCKSEGGAESRESPESPESRKGIAVGFAQFGVFPGYSPGIPVAKIRAMPAIHALKFTRCPRFVRFSDGSLCNTESK